MFSQNLNFTNINADMGLPSNECYRIAQDAKGYIWIATESGLVKYNSRDFIFFNTAKGMPSNAVYALDADTSGRVWFATGNWQVGYIFNDSIHVLRDINFYNKETQNGDVIYKIKYNEHTNSLLVSSHHQTVEIYFDREKSYSKNVIESNYSGDFLLLNNLNKVYVANIYNERRRHLLKKYPVYLNSSVKDSLMFPIEPQSVFFTEAFSCVTMSKTTLISLLNIMFELSDKRELKQIKKLPSQIISMISDSRGNVWVGSKKDGLYLFKNKELNMEPSHFLEGLTVSNILEDHEYGLWVTTLERGVFYIANKFIETLGATTDGVLSNKNFIKQIDNKLWFGNNSNALTVFDKDTIKIKNFGNEFGSVVTDVIEIKKGFLVTTLLGIFYLDKEFKKVKQLLLSTNAMVGSNGLLKLSHEKVFSYNNNIFYEIESNKLGLIQLANDVKIVSAIVVNDFIVYNGKRGLYQIKKNKLLSIQTPAAQSAHDVNKLYEDTYGNIWLPASSDTLNILDKTFNLKKQILISEKNINCRNVLQINATSFFVCSNKGLIQISFKDSSFKKYQLRYFNKTNGLPSSDIYNIVFFKNNYYVNTSKGLCFFAEPSLLQHSSFPNTVISSFAVNDSIQTINTNNAFSYKQNNITFQVDALTYKKITQKGFFFKYKLEGFDEQFKLASSNIITYNNLPPGTYKFIAKAFYDNNTEDPIPAELSFTIKPAFWQTWWGILFLFCVGVFIVLLFIQWRIKKVKEQEAEKNAINKTIAEYRFTALKAQMDPHFVFNSINVIQNLILEKNKTEAYNSLGKFSRLIRSILNQSDSVFATIEEEISLIDLFVELNQLRVEHSFTFKKEIQQNTLSCLIPSLIIQPFIENALWHGILPYKGKKRGEIILRVFSNQKDILTIEIQDNGVGRKASTVKKPASVIYKSKGINLIKERLNAYKSINKNCLAELDIVHLEENEIPLGTLVKLKISVADEKE